MTLAGGFRGQGPEPGAVVSSLGPPEGTARVAVVIPARLASSRFPRKVLARDTGKYLIQHVWEGVQGIPGVSRVIIATDSREVLEAAASFGAEARLTSSSHPSGTDRVAEVARDLDEEIIINVQGDEPLVRGEDVALLHDLFGKGGKGAGAAPQAVMTTLAMERDDPRGQLDPNNVKVVVDFRGRALYFSRAPIPLDRDAQGGAGEGASGGPPGEAAKRTWLHHVGIYGYRRDFLLQFPGLKPGSHERRERLEQLRALEHGFAIQVGITPHRYRGIDTREEYREFVRAETERAERAPRAKGGHGSPRGGTKGGVK